MSELKRNSLSVALATAMLLATPVVYAQTAQDPQETEDSDEAVDLDAVVVTGIRRGIEDSIEAKQSSTSIVEAISAEDIGKLPDTSIADSIARLPGLTAQRFGSRPQEIHVRGFAGDFATTTLNGREQVSLGNNRGVEFDQYPSELVNQVLVYKTPDASLIGQGLSATVDLRTVRPLSFPDRVIAVNVRGDMNKIDDNKEYGNRFSISYIDQFADDTVGLALGYARLNNPIQGYQFESWGFDGGGVNGGGKLYDNQTDNERSGFVGTLEFKPTDDYSTVLDVFYSKFDKEEIKRGMEFGLAFGPPGQPISRVDNDQGTAIEATFTNFDPVLRNDFNADNDDLFSIGWNHELRLNDHWTLTADISSSSAKREARVLETYAGLATGIPGDTVSMSLNPDGYFDFDFGYDYADPSILVLTDAGGWGQDGYIKDFEVKDALTSVRLDLERTFDSGFLSSLEFGANLTDRTKSRASNENFLCLQADCARGVEAPVPTNLATTSNFSFAGLDGLYGYDALAAFNSIYFRRANVNNGDINNKNWEVNEKVSTLFVQANINTDLGSIPVRGNVGIQAVNADQSSSGVSTFEGVTLTELATYGAQYTDYLPSLNLAFEFPAQQFLRLGAARQMARPRMDDLRANAGYGINRTPPDCPVDDPPPCPQWSGSGGNAELEPWIADAYDVSYEKYFGNRAYVSVAYFYKDLKSYIYPETTQFDFSQLPVPASVLPTDIPQSPIGDFVQPVNGEGGSIEGYEIAVSLPLDMLWSPLQGFGLIASYSDTESSIQPLGPTSPSEPLPGLSKYVSNATLYYERFGFSTRVSRRSRAAFVGEVQGFGGDRFRRVFEGEEVYDFQMGYTFQSGPLQDLSILLQVNNVNNEPFAGTFDGRDDRPREYFEYGRTYLLGLNYRF